MGYFFIYILYFFLSISLSLWLILFLHLLTASFLSIFHSWFLQFLKYTTCLLEPVCVLFLTFLNFCPAFLANNGNWGLNRHRKNMPLGLKKNQICCYLTPTITSPQQSNLCSQVLLEALPGILRPKQSVVCWDWTHHNKRI